MRKTVLVTGGAGYIGSKLVKKISKSEFSINVFDAFYFGNNIKKIKNVKFIQGDIRKPPKELFNKVDIVIHLAALSNDPTADFNPSANFAINTIATKKLALQAKRSGVKRFIFASSCSIYDTEQLENSVDDENSKVSPTRAYSLSKYKAEKELLKIADKNFCVTILRMGTVFGHSDRMRYDLVINSMVKDALSKGVIKIFSSGMQWRPLIDLNDAVRAYILLLTEPSKKINKQIINISLGNFLIKNIAYIIQETLKENFNVNTKIQYEKSLTKDRSYRVSNEKAAQLLTFKAKITIKKSVLNLVKKIKNGVNSDFNNQLYYNIEWLRPILKDL